MSTNQTIYIGTSGWHHKEWLGPFYPGDMKEEEYLPYYSRRFNTAEIIKSFFQMPDREQFQRWAERTPDEFRFSVKATRYITHDSRLMPQPSRVENFFKAIEPLGDKLGPVMFELPSDLEPDEELLDRFLKQLPSDAFRYVFQFREDGWFNPAVRQVLEAHNASPALIEFQDEHTPRMVTADFVYMRLHGPPADLNGKTMDQTLGGWASAIATWHHEGKDVFCYFHEEGPTAPQNAMRLADHLNPTEREAMPDS
ncbi:DUF72 domain-containing protein [bacterium]|nr:DUF72 domain-containing protein [bacterium]